MGIVGIFPSLTMNVALAKSSISGKGAFCCKAGDFMVIPPSGTLEGDSEWRSMETFSGLESLRTFLECGFSLVLESGEEMNCR